MRCPVADEAESNETVEDEQEADRDFLLGLWVRVANAGKGTVGITIWTGGAIVSGTLVGYLEYLDGVAEEFDRTAEDPEGFGDVFRTIRDTQREQMSRSGKDDDDLYRGTAPSFIHLKDAKTYAPGGEPIPTNRGVWWRGSLDAVDGWCFGELSTA